MIIIVPEKFQKYIKDNSYDLNGYPILMEETPEEIKKEYKQLVVESEEELKETYK